ncbi:reverse transcriptase domain-containing protein [Trichonephila inaurata madagascariensis]|uniref:Reverse transcriptase domain-containing protein n=1 Tax=Trichonephila inaurata madagascariensis TaxID=2747483 RepID=A0A8X6YKH6_9ARAC|nr:reverse transcriptase domain-containing protein [Trichonephila inaurata madagascariensis]
MNEITKRRKTRTVLRASVTKHINKLEQEFDELDTKAKLQQHLDFLTNMLKQINDLDSQIQALITDEKIFDAEIESAIEYSQKINKNESLSMIDRFLYLKSLLGGAAFNVVNGFSLSEENYEKALKLLKQRFGREELVINAHMSKLLNLYPIQDSNNVVGLRKLYDTCEVQIRSLDSLNVTSGMYGHLLYPILIKLIPEELSLAFNRKRLEKDSQNEFDVMELLNFLKIEIECRESVLFQNSKVERKKNFNNYYSVPKPQHSFTNSGKLRESHRDYGRSYNSPIVSKTVEYLVPITENNCIFCKSTHNSEQCLSVSIDDKKDILRKQARCFLCLQKNHRIKDCKKKEFCDICNHKHNRALCYRLGKAGDKNETKIVTATSHCQENNKNNSLIKSPHAIYLQTATATVKSSTNEENLPVRILLDNGNETLSVYSFGADEAQEKIYDVVKIRLENRDQPSLNIEIEALVTDKISATNLPVPETNISKVYKQLKSLHLADSYEYKENKIVILIGSDFYFDVVTGRIKRLDNKLVASETIFGWCIQGQGNFQNQLLSMEIIVKEKSISDQMREFWELENLGINVDSENKDSMVEEIMRKFEAGISYKDKRYKVKLPWKPEMKNALHNNKEVASRRFQALKKSFINDPVYFSEYSKVLEDNRKENIIESVTEENEILSEDNCFYLPHRAVIREDKTTTRLRVVFDASSHSKGQLSLNDCLHTGFNSLPDLFLLLIRFRIYSVVLTADTSSRPFCKSRYTKRTETIPGFFGPQILKTATQVR